MTPLDHPIKPLNQAMDDAGGYSAALAEVCDVPEVGARPRRMKIWGACETCGEKVYACECDA